MKKYLFLLTTIISCGAYAQAPDGNPDIFEAIANGDWDNPATWDMILGDDLDGIPDGDDAVEIGNFDIIVTTNAGFGRIDQYNTSSVDHFLTVNPGISLTGYTVEEAGEVTIIGNSGVSKQSSIIVDGGTMSCTNISMTTLDLFSKAYFLIQNGGSLTVSGNLSLNTFSSSSKVLFRGNIGSGNTVRLGGNVTGISTSKGRMIMDGVSASTFIFDGSAAQVIPINGNLAKYTDVQIENTTGATLEGAFTTTNFEGDLTVSAGGIFNDGGFANVMSNDITISGTYNASGNIDMAGDFKTILGGVFTSSGCNINLEGRWTNNGTYTYFSGDNVTFDGTANQRIFKNNDWYELTCNNPLGVKVMTGVQSIHGIFDIDQGPFTFGFSSTLVLVSDATGTAQMDDIGTGTYAADITVQRYINKTDQSFTSMSSPVTGTSLATWQANGILFSGFTGSDYPSFSWNNAHWYNEPIHGSVKGNGWALADNITNNVGAANSYKAYYVYMDATAFNISVTGTPATGPTAVPLSYTSSASADDDGWNLIGNPYPCSVDWDLLYGGNTSDLEDIYMAYSGEYANYGYYWGTATGGGVSVGGVTKDIPHSQGFWVKAKSGGGDLDFIESYKNTTDASFLKSSTAELFRITLTGNINTFQDEAIIYSKNEFSDLYENVDISKFYTMNPDNAPTLLTQSIDGANLSLNAIGTNSVSIPLAATAGTNVQGDYTLDFNIPGGFMEDGCITLEDLHTGNTVDLRTTASYTFTTSDTTTLPRFLIHMVRGVDANVTAPTCYAMNNGQVILNGLGISGSTFELFDESGSSVFSGVASNDEVTITNVIAGTYEVRTDFVGSCSSNSLSITIAEPTLVTADFNLSQDTVYLDQGGVLEVSNLSSGTNFTWDFGDGNTSSEINPTNVYTAPGVYQVMLTSNNDNIGSCTQVNSKNVIVMNGPLSIEDLTLEQNTKAFVNNGKVVVDFDLESHIDAEITLVDVTGKIIVFKERSVYNSRISLISTDDLSSGVYFVNITIKGQRTSQKLFID